MAGAALAPNAPLFKTLALDAIDPILDNLGGERELRAILAWEPSQGHLSVTSRLGGDLYRLPPTHDTPWTAGDTAGTELHDALHRVSRDGEGGAFLADDQHIVLASPDLEWRRASHRHSGRDFCTFVRRPNTRGIPPILASSAGDRRHRTRHGVPICLRPVATRTRSPSAAMSAVF
jgi:hypothetical protein